MFVYLCVRVIATDIEDKKLELARQMGADVTINTRHQDLKEVGTHAYPHLREVGTHAYPHLREVGTCAYPHLREVGTHAYPHLREVCVCLVRPQGGVCMLSQTSD